MGTSDKLAFLFPGQGAQYVGMGAYIFENDADSQMLLKRADEVLGFALSDIIQNGPDDKLKQTEITQPAIVVVEVATGRYLKKNGVKPTIMAGHSLGEYAALVLSEALSFEDAMRLVHFRGKAMQSAVPEGIGTMAAILGLDDDAVTLLCDQATTNNAVVEPAAFNCPGQVVVAGQIKGVEALAEKAKARGARVKLLNVSAPFHCSLLKPASKALAEELDKIEFSDPQTPYVANVDATIVTSKSEIKSRLIDQVCRPVLFTQSLMQMLLLGNQKFIEAGPGKVSVGHLRKVDRRGKDRAAIFAITDKQTDIEQTLATFASN